jgi:hypothetical protein
VESAIGELHLGLHAHASCDTPAGDTVGEVGQQRALPDACIPTQDDHLAATGERVGQDAIQDLALCTASEELWGLTAIARGRCSPSPNDPDD